MSTIRLGNFDRALVLEKRTLVADGAGGMQDSWSAVAGAGTVYAAIRDVTGAAYQRVGQAVHRATHRIVMVYREDIAAGMRLREGGRFYIVIAVLDVTGAREYLEVMATSSDGD